MAGWSCAEDSPDPYGPCAASSPTVVLHCVVEDNSSPRQVLAIHRPQAAGMPQRLAHTAPAAAFPPETIIGVSDSGAVGGITSSPSSSSDSTTAAVPAAETTRLPGAILPVEGMAWPVSTIGSGTRDDAKEVPRLVVLQGTACRPWRLPPVREFVAVGGD
ncbi:unnamed protein product [Lampetra fluviatilis]